MNVEIYSTDTCPNCHAAKDFFKSKQVDYVEHNVSQDAEARKTLRKKGYMAVPVIVIDGQEILGFDEAKISGLLNQ